jgi:hypothetical protein
VIVSMTRSNLGNEIGFISSPERLNVLLSRARDGLIMIGNSQTFCNARRGHELYTQFFKLMTEHGHMYEGLPVVCATHSTKLATLKSPEDFSIECPDGGCKEPW